MLKANALRTTMLECSNWCRANPEAFTVFVGEGNVETTGETPTFVYRYTLVFFLMGFTADIDEIVLPLMAWLADNQPDLLLNPQKNRDIGFKTIINDDDTADLLFELPIRERVKVTRDESGRLHAEHLPEPKPRIPSAEGDWTSIIEDVTWRDNV
ncbi:phage tail protein [Trabulsiella guamensis ATCC 49490]|uniref:Phage tail protein n=1 Tax=Trabulsiella guamensis ATCC 49490 TaxID=1005994 RepID=A0A084ZPS6_9ENTR|nr:phage tail protein [Trabulsiella guamensis]KFB99470.1 phage tail protein [Trabulsiella guamensis ATCC 49490]